MKRAIVIGASSGIGRALVKVLSEHDYEIGLAGRRTDLMEALCREIRTRTYMASLDLTRPQEARRRLQDLIDEMGGVDLIVVNSGVGHSNPDWEEEYGILAVNVIGFAAVANLAMSYFSQRGSGHLVGISSISALRGLTAAYSGSKAFVATYLEGLRLKASRLGLDVHVTDVKPGWVDTAMTAGGRGMFWIASADEAAHQIYDAIRKKRRHVYVTRRWRLMAWLLKSIPYPLLAWLAAKRK